MKVLVTGGAGYIDSHTFIDVNRVPVPYEITEKLGWKAEKNLTDMYRDSWSWQSKNPMGFGE